MLIELAAITLMATMAGDCTPTENGGFEDGAIGWSMLTSEEPEGDAQASADSSIVDGSFSGLNGASLALNVVALGGTSGGTGNALAEIIAQRVLVVTDDVLHFGRGGFFEYLYFGAPDLTLIATAEAETTDGRIASAVLYDGVIDGALDCSLGISILGTFIEPEGTDLDLAGAGIRAGETIELRIRVRAFADAVTNCDDGQVYAQLLVDDIVFCAGSLDGDVNGDGLVDFDDLVTLLAAWGPCPPDPCPADLDGNGDVGFTDALEVLANWS